MTRLRGAPLASCAAVLARVTPSDCARSVPGGKNARRRDGSQMRIMACPALALVQVVGGARLGHGLTLTSSSSCRRGPMDTAVAFGDQALKHPPHNQHGGYGSPPSRGRLVERLPRAYPHLSPPATGPYPTASRFSFSVRNAALLTRSHNAARSAASASMRSVSTVTRMASPNCGLSHCAIDEPTRCASGSTVWRKKTRLASA